MRWWIFRVGIPYTTWRICCSQYAHNFVMQTGILVCEYFSNPRPYAYGDPHMHTAIPICIILHRGIQDLISHMKTISLCIRLVTEISPYAYRHLTNPRTVRLTSVDNPVPGNQEFFFAHLQTIVGQVKKIRIPTRGIV